MKTWEKLIEITELDEFAEAAFRGYNSLNRIQSRIFHTIYYTNGNILVCAPTGACKTNIAMISILHEALAAEVTSTFSHRLSPLNITVRELTGDMQLYKNELEETQMIVATPEKWDVITHKSSHMSLSMLVESTQTMIRIVGLSATLPNYLEQYIGISEQNFTAHIELQNEICYKKVSFSLGSLLCNFVESLRKGYQAMFISSLKDNLNAEVARGTVTNVKEACEWLGYTYLFIRMRLNPLVYGIGWDEVIDIFFCILQVVADPSLSLKQRVLIADAARALDKAKMMRFDEKKKNPTHSLEICFSVFRVIDMVAHSSEIENIVVRDEEQNELETLLYRSCGSIDTISLDSDAACISASLALIMLSHFIKFID
ncbi:hypothetical protein PRUPE_3G238700 [Prunus persica]|uniref:Helicase ATP-binding domain-containing protein n=1 Tax=Prunus persica TaxID=3760 RepID=A0A251Q4U5_PRUPE|nr:hypothetical protein PRUPE_3G238700 [Prunus persica]